MTLLNRSIVDLFIDWERKQITIIELFEGLYTECILHPETQVSILDRLRNGDSDLEFVRQQLVAALKDPLKAGQNQ